MKTKSGHEFELAWNPERLDVVLAVDPEYPIDKHWIRLTEDEARELGTYLITLADTCKRRRDAADLEAKP